jgi:hypothetical protein
VRYLAPADEPMAQGLFKGIPSAVESLFLRLTLCDGFWHVEEHDPDGLLCGRDQAHRVGQQRTNSLESEDYKPLI